MLPPLAKADLANDVILSLGLKMYTFGLFYLPVPAAIVVLEPLTYG